MRRALPLMLSLLLFCAQSAGLLHGLAHAAAHPGVALAAQSAVVVAGTPAMDKSGEPLDRPRSADHPCDKCQQFAHFSGSAALQPLVLALAKTVDVRAGCLQAALVARDAPAWRNRGPPSAA